MRKIFPPATLALFLLAWCSFVTGPVALAQSNIVGSGITGDVKSSGGGGFSITPASTIIGANASTPINGSITYPAGCTYLLILVGWNSAAATTIATMTLSTSGSVTQISGAYNNNTNNTTQVDAWVAASPTGTGGTLAITYSGVLNGGNSAQVTCVHASTTTLAATNSNAGNSTFAASLSATGPAIPAGGGIVAFCDDNNAISTITFTTLTTTVITYNGQFVPQQSASGYSTSLTGTPTIVCEDSTLANASFWNITMVSIGP